MSIKPDLEVNTTIAQAIVDGSCSGRTVATVKKIHGGEIAAVYELAFAPYDPPLVLKVYPDALHWKMRKEASVAGMLQDRLSVAVPRILASDDSKRLLDLNFNLMTRLDGALLGPLEATLTPAQRTSAYIQIGQLLREFHRIPMDAFGYIGPNGIWTAHPDNHSYLTFQFDRKLKEFADRGGSPTLARRVEDHVRGRADLFRDCTQPVLCHNDLHAGNLLISSLNQMPRLCGVLDFEGALAGDPLMDVAKAAYYLDASSRGAILDGYGDLGRPRWSETLDLYHLYFVLELWCWMAQIGNTQPLDKLASDLERSSSG
jgi:aminoglycoside phosphotransferase (APT) family kinase protein